MANLNGLAQALRSEFKDPAASIKLQKILVFIKNYAGKETQRETRKQNVLTVQNAKPTRKNAPQETRTTTQESKNNPEKEKATPSYAEIAKGQPKKPTKPPTLPKSLQNRPKPA